MNLKHVPVLKAFKEGHRAADSPRELRDSAMLQTIDSETYSGIRGAVIMHEP